MRRLIDLSHTVFDGLVTYKGLPAPVVCDFLSREDSEAHYAPGTRFHIGRIDMVANTGTYIDAPFHRFEDGDDIAALALEDIADVEGVVVRVPEDTHRIDADRFDGVDVDGKAVLVATGWSSRWNSQAYFEGHPFLTETAARLLVERGARLVGTDSYNVDDTADGRRPVHTVLLGAGVPIVEHLDNLAALPDTGFTFHAVPPKVTGMGTFAVRAFARCRT